MRTKSACGVYGVPGVRPEFAAVTHYGQELVIAASRIGMIIDYQDAARGGLSLHGSLSVALLSACRVQMLGF